MTEEELKIESLIDTEIWPDHPGITVVENDTENSNGGLPVIKE